VGASIGDLIGLIKNRRLEIALSLAEGGAINIESYHRLVGQNMGLGEVLIMIDQLMQESEKDL
jgi:hypothetical protein